MLPAAAFTTMGDHRDKGPAVKRILTAIALLLLAAFLYTTLVEVPRQVRYPARTPIASSPADVGLAYESFQVSPRDADLVLEGWWMPARDATATLLFLHGGTSNRDSRYFKGIEFYRDLVASGISVAAIDLRNHGASGAHADGVQFGRTEYHDALALADWARAKAPGLPLYLMGISMGGATAIHAVAHGVAVDGLILLDSLLLTGDGLARAVWAYSGIPGWLLAPSGWAAQRWHGFPGPGAQARDVALTLDLPILAIQDPGDPVTTAAPMRELAARNPNISLWLAPEVSNDDPRLAEKGRWGSHVAAFALFPEQTLGRITDFIARAAQRR